MQLNAFSAWIVSCLLLGLRTAPVFVMAPPFSLIRMPGLVRPLFGLALSVCLVAAYPKATSLADFSAYGICIAAMRELMLGMMFVLAFQLVFGALYLAGRTIDVQAGYGFALLIDPASQNQVPLVGMLFAYAAAAVFFSFGGHIDLFRLLAASLDAIPLGSWTMPHSIERLAAFLTDVSLTALGVAAGSVLVMFLIDITVALMSRTVPQMNVLVLGFQLKTLVLFLVLPLSFGVAGTLLIRLMTMTLQALPRLL